MTRKRISDSPSQNRRAWVVPLHSDGRSPRAHLLAFSRYGDSQDIEGELRSLVEGHGLPWRAPLPLAVDRGGRIAGLPRAAFLGAAISRRAWFEADSVGRLREARLHASVSGTAWACWLLDPRDLAPGDALWREGRRGVLVVDLDAGRIAHAEAVAWMSLPYAVRPVVGYEAVIEDARAQGWDSAKGTFASPADTRRTWRTERASARRVFAGDGRTLIPRSRRRFVEAELRRQGKSLPDLRDEVQRGFETHEVRDLVRDFLIGLRKHVEARPDALTAIRQHWAKAYFLLLIRVKTALATHIQETILPGRRRPYETSRETVVTDLPSDDKAAAPFMDRVPDARAEASLLDNVVAQDLAERLRRVLTPAEREVWDACIVGDEAPKDFANRTGRVASTVYVLRGRIESKARGLLGSS